MLCGWQHFTETQRAQIATGIAENRVLGGPYMLEIHPTNQCTVKCFFCYCEECRHGETLAWETLEPLLREGARHDVRFLRLSGGGESLLYPKINELLDLCGELGLRIVDLTTNATRLEPVADKIVQVGLDFAMISLNEAEPDRYGRMMQVTPKTFEKAIRGVEALVRARDAAPPERRPKISIQFMVWRENFRHLKEMEALGRALGADTIVLKGTKFLPPELRIPAEAYGEVKSLVSELVAEDCGSGRRLLEFDLSSEPELNQHAWQERQRWPANGNGPDFTPRPQRIHYCYMGWVSTLVSASGLVYPCCPLYGLEGKEVGNIYEESLQAIWTGKRYQRFRSEFQKLRRLNGKLEHSRRLHQYMEPICIHEYGCLFGYNLCDSGFYEAAAARADAETPAFQRLATRLVDAAVRQAHRLANWWRG